MKTTFRAIAAVFAAFLAGAASGQVTFYAQDGFRGSAFATDREVYDLGRYGFNNRASSVVVERGRWEVCDGVGHTGRCTVLRQGQYPSLAAFGFENSISSARPAPRNARYANEPPPPPPTVYRYDYYPRYGEQVFQADVVAVRAVVGPPQERCWIEREHVVRDVGPPNVGGAIAGALIGGILGHQIGGGRGNDVATALGAIGGATVGANAGGGRQVVTQDVRRCQEVRGPMRPEYWDVTYVFRGREHRVQMSAPPGPTITVNRNGEPRM